MKSTAQRLFILDTFSLSYSQSTKEVEKRQGAADKELEGGAELQK